MTLDSPPNLRWNPFISLFMREVMRFRKIISQTILTPLISIALYILIFGISIGNEINIIQGVPYIAFLVPGLIVMSAIKNAFDNATGSIVTSKFCGELEDYRMVPLSQFQIIWAIGLAAAFRGVIIALMTLLIGEFFSYYEHGLWIPLHQPILFFFFIVIGGIAYANLGLSIAMFSKTFEEANSVNTFVLMPLIYLGGVFFSLDHLSQFWRDVSYFNPLLYLVNGVRYSMLGITDVEINTAIIVTLVSFFSFLLLALWSLKRGSYHRW